MKPIILSLLLFVSSHILSQTLFFDDFEETISNDAIFTKWTTENIEGWHYWHIIPWNGNPGQCMRFQNTDVIQNDWLITKPINCEGYENLKVNFSHLFHGIKVPPRLFYTNQYNGNAGQSVWKELSYSFGANENQWYQSDDFIIENPGDVIYFAFHYQAAANAGTFFLMDNFSVKKYIAPPVCDLVGSSEHFEFYTNQPENTEFGSEISESLENLYQKYVDNWNSPGGQDYIDSNIKTKVYLTQKEYMDVASDILELKAGYINFKAHEIYLTPLDSPEKLEYYKDIKDLAINSFAQYAVALKSVRDFNNILPEYFLEGFGLYEQGYRPDRDSVVSFVNENSTQHSHDLFLTFRDFQSNSIKDIIVAYVQRSVLFHGGITLEGIFPETWNKFLLHFYLAEEEDRLMKNGSTEYFDIYCTSYDTIYVDSMKVWLERTRVFYNETYEMNFKILVGLYVMKDAQMGMDITGYGSFTGGTGGINISPRYYTHPVTEDGIAGYPWLLAHEIGHVYNGIMSPQYMWVGFHHEGMANLSGYLQYGIDWRGEPVQIDFTLNYYQQNFGRPPTLTEFYTNPHHQQMGTYYGIHPYLLGLEFYRMLYENYGGVKIKEFFQAGHDCTVFGKDSVAIHNEYITTLKHIRNLIPFDTIINLPFYDSMESFDNGWSRPCINNNLDNWDISDDGLNGGNCMEFQTYNNKNQPIVTWLVSPKFVTSQLHDISTSFDYLANGNDIALEVYYAQDFKGNTEQTNWNFLYDCNALDGGWHNTDDISFECSFDSVFIGIKFLTQGNQWDRVKIDNFEVKITSPFDLTTITTNDATSESQTSAILNGAILSDGGTSITQRGFYWSSTNTFPNSDDHVELVAGTTGSFNKTIENLTAGTTYYFRAFATNSEGTAIGEVKQFETLSPTVLADLPFSDDFSNNYENWTTVSVTGYDVWHISNDDGIDFGKCARFYPTSNPRQANNDWLFTPVFNTEGITNLAVSFKYLFTADGASPEFYYAAAFDGNPANSNWVHIDKSFWINNWGWQDARIEITNPGESFVFAVRYNVAANDSYYFLMDNFSIEAFEPVVFEKMGTTDHFEFYAETSLGNQNWNEINTQVEDWYASLCSYWDRPGRDSIYQSDAKFKIYLTDKSGVDKQFNANYPEWKYGGYTLHNELFVAVPSGGANDIYQGSFVKVVKNTLSQLILKKRFQIDGIEVLPDFFSEGFGMYYSGLRADRDSILKAISDLGRYPQLSDIESTAGIDNSYKRDMILSYIEAQTLSSNGIQWIFPGPYKERWENHFLYYFEKEEDERMKVRKETPRFNIYSTQKDEKYLNVIGDKLEEKLSIYENTYKHEILHRINCVVYPNSEAGVHCLVVMGRYNGGSGWSGDLLDILSPDFFGLEGALDFLIPHEFFHVYHFNIVRQLFQVPSFFSEGLANFMAAGPIDAQHKDDIWKLEPTFKYYYTKFSREPNLEELMSSQADPETGYSNDPYFFGELFYNYLYPNLDEFSVLKDFFGNDQDWSVLPLSYEEIDHGYIKYLKGLARIIPVDTCYTLPFYEPFTNFDKGWTKPSIHNPDNWQIDDGGTNGTNCARFYTSSDKNVPIESWLISPPIDAGENDEVKFSFDFARFGEGIELDVFYTNKFEGYTDNANWTSVKSIEMPTDWNWSNSGEISINNPPDSLFIGLRKKSSGEQHLQLYVDNFNVDGTKTNSKLVSIQEKDFKIYPNPITTESIVSFQTKNNDKVKLAVYDIQGRKICTLLDERLNAGIHTIKIENQIRTNGVYLCKLATSEGVSTLKLIVNLN